MGCHFLFQGNLPNPGIELGSLALQADSLLSEPLGNPKVRSVLQARAWREPRARELRDTEQGGKSEQSFTLDGRKERVVPRSVLGPCKVQHFRT